MNKKLILPVGLLVASMAIVPAAMSMGKNHDHKERERIPMLLKKKAIKHLELSDQQQVQIKDLYDQAKANMSGDKEAMKALKDKWQALASADTLDETALLDIATQQAQIKAKLRVNQLKTKKAVGAILNEDQKEKMARWKHKRHHKMRSHH